MGTIGWVLLAIALSAYTLTRTYHLAREMIQERCHGPFSAHGDERLEYIVFPAEVAGTEDTCWCVCRHCGTIVHRWTVADWLRLGLELEEE
jgi:hypothetical protein